MASQHTVQQGEHIAAIADGYGFRTYDSIWNHPNNMQLRELRQTPNVLFPGDVVFIPDKVEKTVSCATGHVHRFVLKESTLELALVLRDSTHKPIAGAHCDLVDGQKAQRTDADGRVSIAVPVTAKEATVQLGSRRLNLKLGHLDPVSEESGQRARLRNLGYLLVSPEAATDSDVRSAVEEFQCDVGLTVDGSRGAETLATLLAFHGS